MHTHGVVKRTTVCRSAYIPEGVGGYHSKRRLEPAGRLNVLWHFRKKSTSCTPKMYSHVVNRMQLGYQWLLSKRNSLLVQTLCKGKTWILDIQCESKKSPPCDLRFSDIFSQTVENFKSVLYTYVPIYDRLQIFIQLPQILTKLCHIKRNYVVHMVLLNMSAIGRNTHVQMFA